MSNSANNDNQKSEMSKIKEAIYNYKKGKVTSDKKDDTKSKTGSFLFKKPK